MIVVTRELVEGMHEDILDLAERSGEEIIRGIRSEAIFEEIIEHINKSDNLFEKAAWALYSADVHPFWDGQKRTAHQLADLILRSEGYHIHTSEDEIIATLLRIARYECNENIPKIVKWLEKNVQKLDSTRQLHFG